MARKYWQAIYSLEAMNIIVLAQCITKGARRLLGLWDPNVINSMKQVDFRNSVIVQVWYKNKTKIYVC